MTTDETYSRKIVATRNINNSFLMSLNECKSLSIAEFYLRSLKILIDHKSLPKLI